MKYVFAGNINNTGETGIVDIHTQTLLCLCNEEKAKIILKALIEKEEPKTPEKGAISTLIPCIDYTFATRLKSFVSDIQCGDQAGQEERDYIERVAIKLLEYQQKNVTDQWEIDYLERCHGNHNI